MTEERIAELGKIVDLRALYHSETQELLEGCREALRDKERLDWLSDWNETGRIPSVHTSGWALRDVFGKLIADGPDLRSAIDSARGLARAEASKADAESSAFTEAVDEVS